MIATTTPQWTAMRTGLDRATTQFVNLLRQVDDGEVRAVGDWTIAQTAAHVATLVAFDSYVAVGLDAPPQLGDLLDMASTATPVDVARLNDLALERYTERDLDVLAAEIDKGVADLLAAAARLDGAERVSWLGGADLGVIGVLGHLLSELFVHGFDIATATKRPWLVPSAEAALTFEVFFVDLLRGFSDTASAASIEPPADFACEFRVTGTAPVVMASTAGRLMVEEPGRPVDVRITGDASILQLVMYGRINPLGPLLRRKMTVFGRRPWRLRHLKRMLP